MAKKLIREKKPSWAKRQYERIRKWGAITLAIFGAISAINMAIDKVMTFYGTWEPRLIVERKNSPADMLNTEFSFKNKGKVRYGMSRSRPSFYILSMVVALRLWQRSLAM